MRRLSSLAWRSLVARRARTFLTIIGIALGVGVLFATLITNAGIERSSERTVRDIVGRADLRVTALGEAGLSSSTLAAIATTPGVAVFSPELQQRTYLQREPGLAATGYEDPVTVLGVDPAAYGRLHDLPIVAGSPLATIDEPSVLITRRLADATGLAPGARLTMLGAGAAGPVPYRIVGIVAGDGPLLGTLGRTVIVPIEAARRLFGLEGASRADLGLAPGVSVTSVSAALEQRLTRQPYVLSTPSDLAASLRASAADFQATTALLAAIALFVGAFLIFNTLSMTVAERVREVGLLRAAGTTRRQVNGLILFQATVLGWAGSLLGLVVGAAIALGTAAAVGRAGDVPLGGLDVTPDGTALAVATGLLVTLAAAIEPAWRAGRISPVEALKARLDPASGLQARLRWLVIVFVAVAVAGVVAWPRSAAEAGLGRPLAVYGILLVATILTPFLLGPLGRIAGLPFAVLLPAEERLTRGALGRDRSRTALTLGALTVGLAMVVAIGGLALNARQAATAWLSDVVPGDEVITSIRPAALDEGLQDELAAVDGVERVTPIATFELAHAGLRVDAAAIVGADLLADGRLRFVAGDRAGALAALDAGGAVVVPEALASRLGVRLGDTFDVLGGSGGPAALRVVGIAARTLPGRGGEAVLVGWPDAPRLGVLGADFFAVRFAPGRAGEARPALESVARSLALEPSTLAAVEGAIGGALGRLFGLFDALAILAVVMAGLGIVNTLTMNVVERVREIGVLRATGMTRGQVARMVVVEAGVVGLVGAILGGGAGLVAGAVMVALAGGAPDGFEVPWATLLVAGIMGVVVAMVAAWQPARLASRISIIRALQFE